MKKIIILIVVTFIISSCNYKSDSFSGFHTIVEQHPYKDGICLRNTSKDKIIFVYYDVVKYESSKKEKIIKSFYFKDKIKPGQRKHIYIENSKVMSEEKHTIIIVGEIDRRKYK